MTMGASARRAHHPSLIGTGFDSSSVDSSLRPRLNEHDQNLKIADIRKVRGVWNEPRAPALP